MKRVLAFSVALAVTSCQPKEGETKTTSPRPYTFDRSQPYTLAPPIREDDQWLQSFKEAYGYGAGWETWVWRKTDIDFGDGATVYARDENEVQFFITGFKGLRDTGEEFDELAIDYRDQMIGWDWGGNGMHIESLSPSKKYFVVITENPRSYVSNGMTLKERLKCDFGWDFEFKGDLAKLWKRVDS